MAPMKTLYFQIWNFLETENFRLLYIIIISYVRFAGRVESSRRIARAIKQEIQDLDVPVGRAEGLAVDWLSGNIYWTDAKKHVVEVASKDGYYRYALFSGLVNMPHALVLDPPAG